MLIITHRTPVSLSSGDFNVPITGGHYCPITLTLIAPHCGAGSLSSPPGPRKLSSEQTVVRAGGDKGESEKLSVLPSPSLQSSDLMHKQGGASFTRDPAPTLDTVCLGDLSAAL
jgi:hypothetical protein